MDHQSTLLIKYIERRFHCFNYNSPFSFSPEKVNDKSIKQKIEMINRQIYFLILQNLEIKYNLINM
jgi:hypothetical protein